MNLFLNIFQLLSCHHFYPFSLVRVYHHPKGSIMFKIMVDFQGMYVLPLEVQDSKKVHVPWMCELKILSRIMVFTGNTDKI